MGIVQFEGEGIRKGNAACSAVTKIAGIEDSWMLILCMEAKCCAIFKYAFNVIYKP